MIEFAHIIDDNLGDRSACPIDHFDFGECKEVNFRDVSGKGNTLIIGGGGMFYPQVDDWIFEISKIRKVIIWGVGLNYYDDREERIKKLKKNLINCFHVGVRDKKFAFENGYDYVPCSSCMYKEFDEEYEIKNEIGIYEHFQCIPMRLHALGDLESIPIMDNKADKALEKAVRFIKSCNTIITNSYHGAYWSKMLGKDVHVLGNGSNRFNDIPVENLEECRELNRKFYDKIKTIC